MKRRAFITLLGSAAAAWPLAARAQQAMPVIGFLGGQSPDRTANLLRAFRRGLHEAGYAEGENVAVEYRWADNQAGRLPELAADLIRRRGRRDRHVRKRARAGRQGGNHDDPGRLFRQRRPGQARSRREPCPAGWQRHRDQFLGREVTAKRLELLRALVPGALLIAVLVNPEAPVTETTLRELEDAAATTGLRLRVLKARGSGEINAAFATFLHERPDALFVSGGFLFSSRQVQLVHLATRHAVPAAYGDREYVEVGGLMSYGTNLTEALRQVGVYAGPILKGAKPVDLPVMQSTKLELVINAEAARMLGVIVPPPCSP